MATPPVSNAFFVPQSNSTLLTLILRNNNIGDKGALGIADGLKVRPLFSLLGVGHPLP